MNSFREDSQYLVNSNIFFHYFRKHDYAKDFILRNKGRLYYCNINEKEIIAKVGQKVSKQELITGFLSKLNRISINQDMRVYDIFSELQNDYRQFREQQRDGLLAALAILKNLRLVTCNINDFRGVKRLKKRFYIFTKMGVRCVEEEG